jgi:hypothetical protein
MIPVIAKAVQNLRWNNVTPRRYFCYCLVQDVSDAIERVKFLKGIDVDPFCQPFMDVKGTPPTKEQRSFSRWVNMKAEYKSRTWEDYSERHKMKVNQLEKPK